MPRGRRDRDFPHAEALSGADRFRLSAVGAIFCLSGVSALIYQVAWQRILALHSGVGIYSVAMIIAAFLAGLGLGSYLGGVLSHGMSRERALRVFALVELAIGLFAFASCFIYYDLLYLKAFWLYSSLARASVVHFASLLLPTTLMGMSLPFVVQAMVGDPRTASRTVGFLYGINVLGAALGSILTPWLFIRWFGVSGAIVLGGSLNLLAGLAAMALGRLAPLRPVPASTAPGPKTDLSEPPGSRPFSLWLALYTLSGFCALSLEIFWFRLMDVAVKSNAFTFGTVLGIYLIGLAAGSLTGGWVAVRLKHPLKAFLLCQCLLLIYSGAAVWLLVAVPTHWPLYRDLFGYWGYPNGFQLGQDWVWTAFWNLYLALPLYLFGLPTVLMGLSFTILQRAVHDDGQTTGRKVGFLQTGNIVGNVAGSLLCALLLLNVLQATGTLRLLIGLGLVFAVIGFRYYGPRWSFAVAAVAQVALLFLLPSADTLWRRLHGVQAGPALFSEDATYVVGLIPDSGRIRLAVNGKLHSWLPFGGNHSQLGAIPALMHAEPRDVAIIGLGSGDTAWASGCRLETRRITVFELSGSQPKLLERIAIEASLAKLSNFLADPRVEMVIADGRNAIARDDRQFDIIEADALFPSSAYSGNIYSLEFFRLCAGRLKPGGLMCTWCPTERVYRTFREAFPHVVSFNGGEILVGGNQPITIELPLWLSRISSPAVGSYFPPDIIAQIKTALHTIKPVSMENLPEARLNLDLFPRDEFAAPPHR